MRGNTNQGKRNWKVDNNIEGVFEDSLDEFFSREEVSAALHAANDSKVGAPFRVPDIVIEWGMDQVASRKAGYRTVARMISNRMIRMGFSGISYSQFHKRAGRLSVLDGTTDVTDARVMAFGAGAPPRPVPITVAVDSTGLSPDRPSGWMVEKWDCSKVRGWYKLHAAVDVETGAILSYMVTEPYYHDSLAFDKLIDIILDAGHNVACILADAAYDKKDNWRRMSEMGIEFIANINSVFDPKKRGCTAGKFRGCAMRGKHVLRIIEVGREKWKEEVGYSRRWRVEGTFSDLKRMFGDTLRARARERVAELIGRVVHCFNRFKVLRWSL